MATQTIDPPFAPRGQAKKWDASDWATLLAITADDYESAIATFERHVSTAYRGLITGDGWTFEPQKQEYVRRNGRVLGDDDLKSIMLLFVLSQEHELENAAESMARGDTEIEDWQEFAASIIKDLYVAAAIVAAGGVDQLTPEDTEYVIGSPTEDREVPDYDFPEDAPAGGLADAFTRLQDFADAVEAGEKRANTSAGVIYRGGLYAAPANTVFEEVRRSGQMRRTDEDGNALQIEERNVLDDQAQHCRTTEFTEGCPEITASGWAPIGSYPAPGLRTCGAKCRCRMVYREKPDAPDNLTLSVEDEDRQVLLELSNNNRDPSNGQYTFGPRLAANTGSSGGGNPKALAASLTGGELGTGLTDDQLRDAAEDYAKKNLQGKSFVNLDTGRTIRIARSGINKVINSAADIRKAQLVPAIPDMIEHGRLIKTEMPTNPTDPVVAYYRFQTRVRIGTQDYDVNFLVRELSGGEWYYNHGIGPVK